MDPPSYFDVARFRRGDRRGDFFRSGIAAITERRRLFTDSALSKTAATSGSRVTVTVPAPNADAKRLARERR
jgi:hypothetical protein